MAIDRETTQTTLRKTDLVILHRRHSLARKAREETTTILHSEVMNSPASRSLCRDNHPNRNATLEVARRIHATLRSHNTLSTLPKVLGLLLRPRVKTAHTPTVPRARQIRIVIPSRESRFLAPIPMDKAMAGMCRPLR
jgi:hypothetical protein